MDTISNYVDSVFEKLPNTPELLEQKQAMLTKMQDKYNQLKAEGKSEHEAISSALAAHGNIDDFKVSDIPPGFPPTHNYAGGVMPSAS